MTSAAERGLTELNGEAWRRLHKVSASSYVHKEMGPYLLIQ